MGQYRIEDSIDVNRMRKERIEKARTIMNQKGVGAFLCFHPDNIQYLTDVSGGLPRLHGIARRNALFPRTGDPILFEWGLRYRRVRDELAPWLKGKVYPGWRLGQYLSRGLYPEDFIADLKKRLSEHGVLNEPIAIDGPVVTLDFPEIFKRAGLKVVDGGPLLFEARKIKTEDEIKCQKMAASICDRVFTAIQDAIKPGVRECDLQAIGAETAVKAGSDTAPEFVLCSGENTSPNMGCFSDRPLRAGDMIFIDPPLVEWRGYHVCYYRTFTCGPASRNQKETYRECLRLLRQAMAHVKAGKTTADVCQGWPPPEHWGANNWWEISEVAIGHGIGLGVQEIPVVTPLFSIDHPVILEENMVLALETWYSSKENPREGVRIEETMVVKKDGYELLTKWPIDEVTEAWK